MYYLQHLRHRFAAFTADRESLDTLFVGIVLVGAMVIDWSPK